MVDTIKNVFVYGTLKRGQHRADILQDNAAHWTANTHLYGYLLHKGPFPALILEEGGHKIHGELWGGCSPKLINILDGIEGVPSHYHRVPVELANGAVAWVYVQPFDSVEDDSMLIPSGEWHGTATWSMQFSQWWKNAEGTTPSYKMPSKPQLTYHQIQQCMVVKQSPRKENFWTGGYTPPPPKKVTPWDNDGCIPGVKLEWAGGTPEEVSDAEVRSQAIKGI